MKQSLSFDFRGAAVLACALVLATACTQKNSQTQTASQNRTLTAPTGATVTVEPEDAQWTMPAKNYASTRFSGLEVGKVVREICPAAPGAKDWQPSAFSPRTGLVYIPHQNLCMDFEGLEANYIAGTPYVGANVRMYAGPGGNRGEFLAWDPVKNEKVWAVTENFPGWSGALVTAGDVVFYGTMEGWFKALDAKNGN